MCTYVVRECAYMLCSMSYEASIILLVSVGGKRTNRTYEALLLVEREGSSRRDKIQVYFNYIQ